MLQRACNEIICIFERTVWPLWCFKRQLNIYRSLISMKVKWELEVFPWTHSESNRRRKCQQFHRTWMTSAAWMRRLRFVLPHPNTLKQNSEEYSQEWKSSTLQVQDQIHGLRDQIWAIGLNSSTSQYGAQEQAVEYLVKYLIRIDKNCRTDQVVSDVSYILHGQKDSLRDGWK